MKNHLLQRIVLALLLCVFLLSSVSDALQISDSAGFEQENHEFEIAYPVNFSYEDLLFSTQNGFDLVEICNGSILNKPGYPIIPAIELRIALPVGFQVSTAQIIEADRQQLPGVFNLHPSLIPQPVDKQSSLFVSSVLSTWATLLNTSVSRKVPFYFDQIYPDLDQRLYPSTTLDFIHQSDLAGQAIAVLHCFPVQYIPSEQKLCLFTNITIGLSGRLGYRCSDYVPHGLSTVSQQKYRQILKQLVVNPAEIALTESPYTNPLQTGLPPGSFDHVIITSSFLEPAWDDLIYWHTRRGLKDRVITTEYIFSNYDGSSDQQKIRNFIIDAHQNWGTLYFLLGGEHEVVPLEFRNYYEDTPSDQYYSDFDDDWVHEVFVGRFTADDAVQIQTFTDKIIQYETNPPLSNYLNDILLIGMDLSIPPTDPLTRDEYLKEDIDTSFIPANYEVTKVYDTDIDNHKTKALNALDDGQHLVNHADHANSNLLGVGDKRHNLHIYKQDVNDLINTNKPSILVSLGCHTNDYDYGSPTDSISETFVNYNPNRAGIAFTGNTRNGLVYLGDDEPPYYLSTKLDFDWWRSLFSHNMYILGETLVDCKHQFGTDPENPDYGRHCVWTFNLLGEPAMPIWTDIPVNITVTHPAVLPKGMSEFPVHVESSGQPIHNSYVCLWKDDEVYLRGYTDQNGDICFYPNPNTTGTLLVTVTKHNLLPYQGDATVEDRTVLLLKGHCFYNQSTAADTINVTIDNLNTSKTWYAETNGNYYHLELIPGEDINATETLRYISKDNTSWINVTDYIVTQADIDAGYIEKEFTLDEYYLDLIDFPMYHAEKNNPFYSINQLCGAATAQMNLNYMWWNQTQNNTCPNKYSNQTWLFETAQANNSNTSHSYIDADGMYHTLKTYMPTPYERYGYHFDVYNSTNLDFILGQICQWIDYPAGRKPGHPLHVPGAVPTFGDYTRWMSIRGIHMNQSAYPVPEELDVYGFWVNDPHPTGIGENSYKTAEEWNKTYFDPITVPDDPYSGEYVAVCEPPKNTLPSITLIPSPPRYNLSDQPSLFLRTNVPSGFFKILQDTKIIHAAVTGLQEQLIPYDTSVRTLFAQSYPATPFSVQNRCDDKEDYYIIPFKTIPTRMIPRGSHQESNRSVTNLVVIIHASNGHFKEASWVEQPVDYPPITQQQAQDIVYQELYNQGFEKDELNTRTITCELVYQKHSPYKPDWHISLPQLDFEFYVDQNGILTQV